MTKRLLLLLLLMTAIDATAQTARTSSGRVSPEGPYKSQVRLLDDGAAAREATPEELLGSSHDAYGRALVLRQLAQRGIATGDTATAIAYFEEALALASLSPLAVRQMQINLGQLYSLDGRHADAIRLLEAAAAIAPFDDAAQYMTLANSYLQNGRPGDAARQALAAIGNSATPVPAQWTQFAVYAFWQAGEPAAAARWQLRLVDAQPDEAARWIQLAALYREAGDNVRALATLQTAALSGLLETEDDLLRLAQMHLDYGTPDLAVPVLQRLAAESGDAQRWRWLGQTLLRAGDEPAALAALTKWAELDGTPAAWLETGELAASLSERDRAVMALQRASTGAPGAVRGRALLLLGQLEIERGNPAAAKRAFEQASEYGGVYRVATQWLDFMSRSASTRDTADPQTPAGDVIEETAITDTPEVPAAIGRVAIKTVPSLRVYAASETAPAARLTATALELVEQLVRASRRERLEWTGPLHIVVTGNLLDESRDLDIRVAAPIRRVAPRRGAFSSGGLDVFRCSWQRYEGPLEGLAAAWRDLYQRTVGAGLEPTGEARQVVLHRGGAGSPAVVELQIGIL